MTDSKRNFWVGVFVLASLGALAVLMIWFGEAPAWLRRSEWTLSITGVKDLQGVGEGTVVNLNGVEIGRVKGVEFEDATRPEHGVVILASIKRQHFVPQGAVANVYGAMLGIGGGRIEISVEEGRDAPPLDKKNAQIRGEMKSIVGELISAELVSSVERAITNIGNLTEEWTPVGSHLSDLIVQRRVSEAESGLQPNVSTVVERLDQLIANLNAVLGDADVQGDVRGVVGNLKDASDEIKNLVQIWKLESQKLAEGLNSGVNRADESIQSSFRRLNSVLKNLDRASDDLARLSDQLASGEGTIGLLVRDPRLYESAVLSLDRFSEVMQNLLVITGKIKEDGYIVVGQAPSGVLRKKFDTPGGAQPSP